MEKTLTLVFSAEEIHSRIQALAKDIQAHYGDSPLVAVCVLKGAVHFFSDLTRALALPKMELDFLRLSSYGAGTESSRQIAFTKDIETDVQGKHVLIVEDVVDSGLSMEFLLRQFHDRGALSVQIAALIDKKERREVSVAVTFAGFSLEKGYIVGYGMDCAEQYRALPHIYELPVTVS